MAAPPTRTDIAAAVSRLLGELGYTWTPADPDTVNVFHDLGFDSFAGYELVSLVEDTFAMPSSPQDFADTFTVRSIIDVICAKTGASASV